jgi:hypothetical protein
MEGGAGFSIPLKVVSFLWKALRIIIDSLELYFFSFTGTEKPNRFPCSPFFHLQGHREARSIPFQPVFSLSPALRININSLELYFFSSIGIEKLQLF